MFDLALFVWIDFRVIWDGVGQVRNTVEVN